MRLWDKPSIEYVNNYIDPQSIYDKQNLNKTILQCNEETINNGERLITLTIPKQITENLYTLMQEYPENIRGKGEKRSITVKKDTIENNNISFYIKWDPDDVWNPTRRTYGISISRPKEIRSWTIIPTKNSWYNGLDAEIF